MKKLSSYQKLKQKWQTRDRQATVYNKAAWIWAFVAFVGWALAIIQAN